MTINEAIEINEDLLTTKPQVDPEKRREAVMLDIEALKQMKAERTIYGFKRHVRMPGETEEKV